MPPYFKQRKSTMGWFHGFKLHIIINDKGEILNFTITQANVDDRTPLKNICQIEHSRHRSFTNFLANIVAGLIAYSFLPKKPSIKYQTIKSNQLAFY